MPGAAFRIPTLSPLFCNMLPDFINGDRLEVALFFNQRADQRAIPNGFLAESRWAHACLKQELLNFLQDLISGAHAAQSMCCRIRTQFIFFLPMPYAQNASVPPKTACLCVCSGLRLRELKAHSESDHD